MSAGVLLERLDAVRQTGRGRWLARCASHDDHRPSLSIRETEDGLLLLHCYAGCATGDVLAALGLPWDELFPPKPIEYTAPIRRPWPASDVLAALGTEAMIVAVSALDQAHGVELTEEQLERLLLAAERIMRAVDMSGAG